MVLTNAIYFKGKWENQFDRSAPATAILHAGGWGEIKTPMMSREGGFRFFYSSQDAGRSKTSFQVAEIPYRGGELSMVVILPGKHDGLPALEANVSAESLTSWLSQAIDVKSVGLQIPKFRVETDVMKLKEPLQKLGMVDAFIDGVADFSGMGGAPGDLHVSAVEHKAFVDVNEEGTEAAAATAVIVRENSATTPFRADHPFLFLIRDVQHGTILFMGRVVNPK